MPLLYNNERLILKSHNKLNKHYFMIIIKLNYNINYVNTNNIKVSGTTIYN